MRAKYTISTTVRHAHVFGPSCNPLLANPTTTFAIFHTTPKKIRFCIPEVPTKVSNHNYPQGDTLMLEAASTSKASVNLYQDYTAQQHRRQPSK
jgi:hypothetical protein